MDGTGVYHSSRIQCCFGCVGVWVQAVTDENLTIARCVVIEMLTRNVPFPGISPVDAATGVAFRNQTPAIPKNCPQPLAKLLRKIFQFEPSRRPDANDLCTILREMQS